MPDFSNVQDPIIARAIVTAFFLAGGALGSFLNVCFWRIPRGESVVFTPSHCTHCNRKIRWFDNLPIVSYLVLRGRCRYCRTPYSARYFFVETIAAALFAAFASTVLILRTTPYEMLFPGCAALLFAVAIAGFDFLYRVIPGCVSFSALGAGVLLSGCFPQIQSGENFLSGALFALIAAALFGAVLALYRKLGRLTSRKEILGGGDVKAVAATAALLGWQGAFFALLAAALSGTAFGIAVAAFKRRNPGKTRIAFGVFIASGIALWCFGRSWIVDFSFFQCLR